jgi:CHAD domain-containing protein
MQNAQSALSSRIFPAFSEKNSARRPYVIVRANLEPIKAASIKCPGGSSRLEKNYMNTHEAHAPESVERLAKQVFTDLHQTIITHESGSLDGDVESVHDMRVAARRLRVALSNFAVCVPKPDRKRVRIRLENLADALGGVRDLDVMIAAMKTALLARSDEEKFAISMLIRRLRARRRLRLRALKNYLRGEEYAGFKREFASGWVKTQRRSEPVNVELNVGPDVAEAIEEEHGQAA